MNRRGFLTGLAATAAGLLVPGDVAAEPQRRVWALDQTMLTRGGGERIHGIIIDEAAYDLPDFAEVERNLMDLWGDELPPWTMSMKYSDWIASMEPLDTPLAVWNG